MTTAIHPRVGQTGFTLIEALVTALVLGIGLLGMARLQAFSLQNNMSALQRSQATALAYDMADRVRANVQGVRTGAYDRPAVAANCDDPQTTRSPNQLPGFDLCEWRRDLANLLPNGNGVICLDSTPNDATLPTPGNPQCDGAGDVYKIIAFWSDERSGNTPTLATSGNLQFFVVTFQP